MEWATDNLAPAKTIYDAAVTAKANADLAVQVAEQELAAAKRACKVAAWDIAE